MSIQPTVSSSVSVVVASPPTVLLHTAHDKRPQLRRFSVQDYHRMIESGILTKCDRVELIDGWIIEMAPIGPPHVGSTMFVESVIRPLLPSGWFTRAQFPLTLDDGEPQPDVAVTKGSPRDYLERHPGPREVPLVIEVADCSLEFDRTTKLRHYAAASIIEYWIVNLVDRQLEIHREPQVAASGAEYRVREVIGATGSVNLTIEGKLIAQLKVADLMP